MIRAFPIRIALCAIWLLAMVAGIAIILNYENTSGAVGATAGQWPAQTQIKLDPREDTLVMFAHPQCPCTRASIDELNRIMSKCGGHLVAHVLILKPAGVPHNFVMTGLRHSAASIPGVEVDDDPQGRLAQKFGAETSGFVVLYNPQGKLLFSGGITGSRGHEGDNPG